jgi:hypothetical protein
MNTAISWKTKILDLLLRMCFAPDYLEIRSTARTPGTGCERLACYLKPVRIVQEKTAHAHD